MSLLPHSVVKRVTGLTGATVESTAESHGTGVGSSGVRPAVCALPGTVAVSWFSGSQ